MKEKIFKSFHLSEQFAVPKASDSVVPANTDEEDAIAAYDDVFLKRFTYNSNTIEGSTLTLGDTELVLDGEFPVDTENKRLGDVFAAIGIKEGAAFANEFLENGETFNEEFIKDVHAATALDCQPRTRGVYRVVPVYISNSLAAPPQPDMVREYMADLIFAFNDSDEPALVKTAAFHAMFENIHPFRDANGRTGRILLNYMLKQAGYPPIAIKASGKNEYYRALEDWQVRSEPQALIELIVEQVTEETAARTDVLSQTRAALRQTNPTLRKES